MNFKHSTTMAISLMALSLVSMTSIQQEASAVTLEQFSVKVVIDFDYPTNINKLKSDINKDLAPELILLANSFGSEYESFSYTIESTDTSLYPMGTNQTTGDTMYQIYPKLVLSGFNNTKTDNEFKTEVDTTTALIRIAINDFLTVNGGSNVSTHIHFTYGSLDFDEGY